MGLFETASGKVAQPKISAASTSEHAMLLMSGAALERTTCSSSVVSAWHTYVCMHPCTASSRFADVAGSALDGDEEEKEAEGERSGDRRRPDA